MNKTQNPKTPHYMPPSPLRVAPDALTTQKKTKRSKRVVERRGNRSIPGGRMEGQAREEEQDLECGAMAEHGAMVEQAEQGTMA